MGVEKTTYLMFGIRLNEEQSKVASKNWSEEDLNMIDYLEGDPKLDGWSLIYDAMCGEHHFFGKVLEQTYEYDDVAYRVMDDLLESCEESKKVFEEKFNHCFENKAKLGKTKPQLMLINHFH